MKQKILKLRFDSPLLLEQIYKAVPEMRFIFNFPTPRNIWLAGGALRTLLDSDTVSKFSPEVTDIDLFFDSPLSKKDTEEYFKEHPETTWKKVFECPEGKLTTYKNKKTGWKVQLITVNYYSNAEALLESFDFTVTQFATDGEYFWMGESSYDDVTNKRLRWNVITYPSSSLHRMTKYVKKGFHMREEDYNEFVATLWTHNPSIVDTRLVYVD